MSATDDGPTAATGGQADPRAQASYAAAVAALAAQLRPPAKSRTVAILLAVFLGGLGIHKFYLGQVGWGVLYLLFSWTFLPVLAGWIEAVIYLVEDDDEFRRKYG